MALLSKALYFARHPSQFAHMVQWKLQHKPLHRRDLSSESTTATACFAYLDLTGRSFSAVVQELHPALRLPVCIFYLILRGLDTIEDDPSLPFTTKEPLLRTFAAVLSQPGWTFTGNRPEEKDRALLVHFDVVVTEFARLDPVYRQIIEDITRKMGNGMADFACMAAKGETSVATVEEYDLYCWHVAGIVGDGLTNLFIESGLAETAVISQPQLYRSMGLLLQKNNIIRDIHEDHLDGRHFWPKEIWSKHVDSFDDLFKAENVERALDCSSEMILDALRHLKDCLVYLGGLREQSLFNFCAIPQAMAFATLELCFRNPALFERNMKITRGEAFQLMVESSQDLAGVCSVFSRYVRRIQQKNDRSDPNYANINVACQEVVDFAETLVPKSAERDGAPVVTKRKEMWSITEWVISFLGVVLVLGAAWIFASIPKTARLEEHL